MKKNLLKTASIFLLKIFLFIFFTFLATAIEDIKSNNVILTSVYYFLLIFIVILFISFFTFLEDKEEIKKKN